MTDQRLTEQEEQLVRRCLREGAQAFDRTFVEKLLAEIDRLRGERQWQPIESAPKDADVLLLYLEGSGVQPGYWENGEWLACETFSLTGGKWHTEPTHWMPLPAAPDATVPPRPQETLMGYIEQVAEAADRMPEWMKGGTSERGEERKP